MRSLLDNLPGLLSTVTTGAPATSALPNFAPMFDLDDDDDYGDFGEYGASEGGSADYDGGGEYDAAYDDEYYGTPVVSFAPTDGYGGSGGSAGGSLDVACLVDGLNEQQAAAVTHRDGPLLIVAGAGSGKTRVLTHRIAYLIATKQAWPSQILAITFTNKAAAEMRERVVKLIGPEGERMWVSTFHSACVRILRKEYSHLGLKSSFSIYDAADSLRLVTTCAKLQDLDPKKYPLRGLANKISDLKNELVTPGKYADTPGADKILAEVYKEYQKRLKQANALDFDDIIMYTVELLQKFPAVAEHYRRRFRHILVDEYQDTNHAQYVLIKELVGGPGTSGYDPETTTLPPAGLTVVGDSDQSIYAFRGATIRNIEEFEKDYPDATTILLEQNYRSTQNILRAANAVIQANQGRRPKKLWTASGDGTKLIGYVADDEYSEARYIAAEIDRLRDHEGVREGDVAIFYRANAQSRAIEEILIRVGLPYKVIGGTRFYERKEIKDAIAYLRALANPDDEINLRRILNEPKRGIGDRTEALLAGFAGANGISFGAAIERAEEVPGLTARALNPLAKFAELMKSLRALIAEGKSTAEVLEAVLDQSGYLKELRNSDDPQDETRIENLDELKAVATEFSEDNPEGTLDDFLERVALVADSDQIPAEDIAGHEAGDEIKDSGQIVLMTLHTAKGLEFPVVFLTGLEDGTFPHMRSMGSMDELAEERRLAYVGLTRARERLYLTRAAMRSAWGTSNALPESRFMVDIPEDVIDWQRKESATDQLRGESSWGSSYNSQYGSAYGRSNNGDNEPFRSTWASPVTKRKAAPESKPNSNYYSNSTKSSATKSSAPKSSAVKTTKIGGSSYTAPSASPAYETLFTVGDRVTHDSYGMGKVVALEGKGHNAVAKVDFGSEGTKRLVLRFAPLTKL